jgi:hypothetical protein
MAFKEYLLSVNNFNEPAALEGKQAIGLLLVRLILMEPGTDPLHPDMGVGIRQYRYAIGKLEQLRKSVENQINTYLPEFSNAAVSIITCPDKTCNIEIAIDDTVYIYESATAPVPISLEDIKNN